MTNQTEIILKEKKSWKNSAANSSSRLERLYNALSLEYEQLKVKLEELNVEKNELIAQLLHYTMNRRLRDTNSLELSRNWSRSGEKLEVYFQAGEQEVNLNCSFLQENGCKGYSCYWKTGSGQLVSCVGCANHVNSR